MDTRRKIVSGPDCASRLEQLEQAGAPVTLVSGFFDPVLQIHAARLDAARPAHGLLAVLILDPPEPILPARARAELVAALGCVDLVMHDAGPFREADLRFEQDDLDTAAAFIAHVHERQS